MQLLIKFIYSRSYIFTLKLMVEKLTKDTIQSSSFTNKRRRKSKKIEVKILNPMLTKFSNKIYCLYLKLYISFYNINLNNIPKL